MKIIYLGSLDQYDNEPLGVSMPRGQACDVDDVAARKLLTVKRGQPKEFFMAGVEIDAKTMARLEAAYAGYPDRVIRDMRQHAKEYERIAATVDHENPAKKKAMFDGAMSEVRWAEMQIHEHQNLKRRRAGQPELEWVEPDAAVEFEDETDFGPAPVKKGRKAA